MPKVRLSPAFVRNAICPDGVKKIDYFDAEMPGFMLEVRSSGGKTYYQRYTDERGRERQFKVGPADVLTVRQARRKAKQIKAACNSWRRPADGTTRAQVNSDPRLLC